MSSDLYHVLLLLQPRRSREIFVVQYSIFERIQNNGFEKKTDPSKAWGQIPIHVNRYCHKSSWLTSLSPQLMSSQCLTWGTTAPVSIPFFALQS